MPATATVEEVKSHSPDAIFLSNGPGDPSALEYAHQKYRELLDEYPIFGICLGHQILTHAIGASTYKLKFGHRGANQPVRNQETEKVSITSQNHGFAAEKEALGSVRCYCDGIQSQRSNCFGHATSGQTCFFSSISPGSSTRPE